VLSVFLLVLTFITILPILWIRRLLTLADTYEDGVWMEWEWYGWN